MDILIHKYAQKLISAGLGKTSGPCMPLVGGLDDVLAWNRKTAATPVLEEILAGLNINSLIFLRPAEPYSGLLSYLADAALEKDGRIEPRDCETRTFLHDLPVIPDLDPQMAVRVLRQRKSVIVSKSPEGNGPAVIAHGTVSPEQAFVTVSSVCFAAFVKFFTDLLADLKSGTATPAALALFDATAENLPDLPNTPPDLARGPFLHESNIYRAVIEAGKKTVEYGLVDSYFGNVSCCWNNTLYISQTASSLDELSGCIDPVPLDSSTSAGLTASSELSAHLRAIELTGCHTILHGHPKFSVILSMDCDPEQKKECRFNHLCHIKCPEKRSVCQVPIVPGEVGTGPLGLCNTLPEALTACGCAIVYGHGVFATGKDDFTGAFNTLLQTEHACRKLYFQQVDALRSDKR